MVDSDPLPGAVVLASHPVRLLRTGIGHNLGFVCERTMSFVEYAMREFFELP